ncbi:hypothetical protein [Sphingobacterium deserti]|uniref:Uncharacterized protein n=1 Tax=Sphingobacterium deserti TaxID=1229276 RepID=A0A0B8T6Y3_9SPHI|nr:hypothetical protein [Sphingobacterium deserti]KGE13235.1 hypothetical protein DI53_3071 [Sphingobacterium deserti]
MGNFLDKIFGSKIEVDLVRIGLEAKLCFHESRLDSRLANAISLRQDALLQQDFAHYLQRVSLVKEDCYWLASQEIALLQEYISFYERILGDQLFFKFDVKAEADKDIPAFLLFPLVANALQEGYNAMEKFPLKIKIRVFDAALQLDVINHVNHHIVSQEHTSLIDLFKSRLLVSYADAPTLIFNSNSHTFKANLHLPW